MKFFIPLAKDDAERDQVWEGCRKGALHTVGFAITDKKIQSIFTHHNGKEYKEEVGQKTPANGELVVAILECENVYLVCTPNRGVLRDMPMMVGKHNAENIIEFTES